MPYYCTVPRCTSMAGKTKNVSFHQFPRDEELAEIWNKILKRGKPYTKYSKVCSLHFKPEDYSFTSGQKTGQWRTLRKDAIPSKNLPSSTPPPCQRNDSLPWPSKSSKINIGMQHRMVQALYVQTMLSMQTASISTPSKEQSTSEEVKSRRPLETNNCNAHVNEKQQEISVKTDKNTKIFKCDHCSMCFKDPDVFLLHQRNHPKTTIATEETLKANPILANMLKSDKPQTSMQKTDAMDVKNFNNIENQMMADWTTNMDLNNLSTVVTNGSTVDNENSDNDNDSDDAMSNCDNEDSNLVIDEFNS